MIRASHRPRPSGPERVTPPSVAAPRLLTLGGISLADAASAELLGPGKPLALLTYLRSIPGQTATREHLVDLLWADSEPRLGRQALRQILLRLRQTLSDGAIVTKRDEVTLTAPIWHDRDAFLEHVGRGELEPAFELYRGSFFPGFGSAGSLQFEHWVDAERAHLQGLYLRTGDTLARRALEQNPREALRIARVLHRESPESESAWRLVLHAAHAARDLLTAHAEADALERWLNEAGRRAEPATASLIRTVRADAADPEAPRPAATLAVELVGREREFASLLDAWREATLGRARVLHLEAQAGYGKTRLLSDAGHRLRTMGATVLHVSAHQGEQEMRYGLAASVVRVLSELPGATGITPALAAALLGLHPALATRFPGVTPIAASADLLHQRSAALAELLSAVADERPLALFIDDLHWSDAESRQLLAAAANRIGNARVLLVTAGRPGSRGGALLPSAPVHRLAPLSTRECVALVEAIAGGPDPADAERLGAALWQVSRGSPLLALESLHLAIDRGDLELRQGCWWASDLGITISRMIAGDPLAARLATLTGEERGVLAALAIAASPLTLDVLESALGATGRVGPLLPGLEARGYVMQTDAGWVTGHDEIAATVLQDVPDEEQRRVSSALGRGLLLLPATDQAPLVHAIRFLAAGGDDAALAGALRRVLPMMRAQGELRSADQLIADLVLAPPESDRVRRLLSQMPLSTRFGVRPWAAAAALVAITVMGLVALAPWSPTLPPPDIELMVPHGSPVGATLLAATPLRLVDWDPARPIEPRLGYDLAVATGERRYDRIAIEPDGNRVAFTRVTGDSGLTDIYLQGRDGSVRRLTETRGDDFQPSWSPDGRYLLFSTARWTPSEDQDADLAILEVATGAVRQLTSGADADQVSAWSPDGTRIAFLRVLARGDRRELCWIAFAGSSPRCHPEVRGLLRDLAGWEGPDDVLVVRQDSAEGAGYIARMAIDGSRMTMVDARPTSNASVSADGRWILAVQSDDEGGRALVRVFPTSHPELARTVYPEGNQDFVVGAVWRSSASTLPAVLDSLSLGTSVAMPVVGVPHLLRAEARGAGGHLVEVPGTVLRWRVSDTSVASIDSMSGLLSPKRPGLLRVTLTAGGWRAATTELRIEHGSAQPLDSARWTDAEWPRWLRFGTPAPVREVLTGAGSVLLPNGDENFESGVVSARSYAVAGGLGIEAVVSLPIRRSKWQQLKMGLGTGSVVLRDGLKQDAQCVINLPASEGSAYLDQVGLSAPTEFSIVPEPKGVRDGARHRLRLEVLPDGSCRFSADGRTLWQSTSGFAAGDSVAPFFLGHSVGARIMVGPVEMWRGVRGTL